MRFGSVPPRNWQKAHGTMISHEKSTNDISNIVNVIYDGILALKMLHSGLRGLLVRRSMRVEWKDGLYLCKMNRSICTHILQ